MKSIPFYIGVLLIIPVAVQAQTDTRKKLPNGYGIGSVMTTDIAIQHASIKENIQQQALLVWIDAQGRKATHQAAQAIEAIVNNIRYVSIENTWYKIILPPHAETEQQKVVVTVFANAHELAGDPSHQKSGCPEMAMVVERYQHC
jgi:hypothetical protein